MRVPETVRRVFVAVLAGAAGVAGSYAAAGFTPSFVVAPLSAWLTSLMPGAVVTFAILVLGDLGQQVALGSALLLAVAVLGAAGLVGRWLTDRLVGRAGPIGGAALAWLTAAALTGAPLPAVGAGVGVGLVIALDSLPLASGEDSAQRRRVLRTLAGAVGVGGLGLVLGRTRPTGGGNEPPEGTVAELLTEAEEKSLDVSGLEPLVSGKDFYEVDISVVNPSVRASDWSLSVTGAVEQDLNLDYEDVTGRESHQRFMTLRCVGEGLNGHKMDNGLWTVVPIEPLLEEAGLTGEYAVLHAQDDYFEEFPVDALRRGYLAYEKEGNPLPRKHGFPVRALIPGHWGEINVKWLTEIEIADEPVEGYWEQRGWHGTGPVHTVAKLHAVNHLDDGRIEVGGHTYAGTRGIARVEVSTDGGDSWTGAELSDPLPGEDVWRQWVHRYDSPGEEHEVVVRAIDGTGAMQPKQYRQPYPQGPTGWVSREIGP